MILRRVISHVKAQNWTAVALDFLIVVMGVFMGIQVSNWNDARADHERSENYLSRIRADIERDRLELQDHQIFWGRVTKEGYAAIAYAETGELNGATDWETLRAFLHASQAWTFSFIDTTYAELRSAGELDLIADANLRSALADYYVAVVSRRGGGGHYGLLPAYREMVRGRTRADIMRYYWAACFRQGAGVQEFVDCPPPPETTGVKDVLEQIALDEEIIDALRYWVDTVAVAAELAEFDLARTDTLIDLVEAQ